MRKRDSRLARLLSGRDQMSRPEKERILDAVLSRVDRPSRARVLAISGAVAVAAAAVVLVGPWALRPSPEPEFAARGDGEGSGPGFRIVCSGEGGAACQLGGHAAIDVWDWAERPYFAALARGPEDLVIWYFAESADGQSLDLRGRSVDGVLDAAISLGPPHRGGELRILGVFSARPLTRADVRAALSEAGRGGAARPDVRVVERKVTLR